MKVRKLNPLKFVTSGEETGKSKKKPATSCGLRAIPETGTSWATGIF